MVVGDLPVPDHEVVREHAADGFVKATADRLLGNIEVLEHLRSSRAHLVESQVDEMERHRC